MPYVQRVATFRTDLNRTVAEIVDDFNTLFSGGSVQLQDVDFHRLQSPYGSDNFVLRILYAETTIGLELEAFLFITDQFTGGDTAQEKFDAFFAAANCYVPLRTIDVTNHEIGKTNPDTLLVITAITDNAGQLGLLGHEKSVYIAEPIADIAAAAAGACIIYDSNGNVLSPGPGGTSVTNGSGTLWAMGDRSYALFDPTSGELVSIAVCNGAVAPLVPDACPPPVPPPNDCATRENVSTIPTLTSPWI